MGWHPPVPAAFTDDQGTQWQVIRAWPGMSAGDFTMEVFTSERPGVRAARLRAGRLKVSPDGYDRLLPVLLQVAPFGEVIVHRARMRAVVRTGERYLKVLRLNYSAEAAVRHTLMSKLLGAEDFLTPELVSSTPGCLTLSGLPGRSLFELGQDPGVSDAGFEGAWERWVQAWVRQQSQARAPARRSILEGLPPRPAAVEVENLQRIVDLWLLHAKDVPAARAQRAAVRAAARRIAQQLSTSEPDPLVWSHGDLHDKQIFTGEANAPLGLLDFDEAGRAEAAADLANLFVHLTLRLRQRRLTAQRYQTARQQVIAAAAELRVTPARFGAYANATSLRLGCLYSFRPQWAGIAEEFLSRPSEDGDPLSAAAVLRSGAQA